MTTEQKRELAIDFATALKARNTELLQSFVTEDVVWSLPGTSLMSGEVHGVDGILMRAEILDAFEVNVQIEHIVVGYKDVGFLLHNTGRKDGRLLDEHLTTILTLRGNKIQRLDTLLSDVPMLNAYFVK
ncbi:nuclear transport factor 2 family protein [Granulicella sp. L60]|uniref:nuclear transport factor 2 family protein n=1 Tax=Granulicella sp. L60 TaxID=1641866 RepID=UPI00131D099F|nr:nuclear transport factor 2 family protein [Granulicella sp. L60]